MKNKFFDFANCITWLKSVGIGIVAFIVSSPVAALMWFTKTTMPIVSGIIGLAWLALYALSWGYFSKRFFGWH